MSGALDFVGDVVGGVGDLIGQGTEWIGERTGLGFLDNAGEYISNDQNAWIQQLLGAGALGGLGYGAFNMMMPTDGMFFGGAEGMFNPVAGWSLDATSGGGLMEDMLYGMDYGGLGDMYGGSLLGNLGTAMSDIPGMGVLSGAGNFMMENPLLTLGGLNLLSQYYGSQAAQRGANEGWDKTLAAQQAYMNTQRADIAAAQNNALKNWSEYGFPSTAAVQAGIASGKGAINKAAETSGHTLDEKLGARGIGQGSGELGRAWTGLESSRMADIGKLTQQMTQFGLTPYSAPPITMAYPGMPSVPQFPQTMTFGENLANTVGGLTGTLGGMYAYDWLKNR